MIGRARGLKTHGRFAGQRSSRAAFPYGVRQEAYRQFAEVAEAGHHPVTLDFLGENGNTIKLRPDVDNMNDDGTGMSEELQAEVV